MSLNTLETSEKGRAMSWELDLFLNVGAIFYKMLTLYNLHFSHIHFPKVYIDLCIFNCMCWYNLFYKGKKNPQKSLLFEVCPEIYAIWNISITIAFTR